MRLWDEFTKSLARELNANEQDLSFADPLRVAEEYRAYFGQAALNDRIRFEIENEAWRTGPLYRSLLGLPWSEVLTTNWDTLLEQAATEIHSPYYTPVTKASDLAWAQSPRIVKLHGTIGVTETFIAAQEDYRTYPERFAPFVNLARQVFIENELCLLGFSGAVSSFSKLYQRIDVSKSTSGCRFSLASSMNETSFDRSMCNIICHTGHRLSSLDGFREDGGWRERHHLYAGMAV